MTTPAVPDCTAGAKVANFAVNPEVSGMPAKARRRKAKTPATTGWCRPRPAHWERCEASDPSWRTIATTANAAIVVAP